MFHPLRIINNISKVTRTTARLAHTYSRQDRGLYGGTHKQFGNSISESHRKTARTWSPNVHNHTTWSRTLGKFLTLRMPASVWRTINKERYAGDIDAYLSSNSKAVQRSLGLRGQELRRQVQAVKNRRDGEKFIKTLQRQSKLRDASIGKEVVSPAVVEEAKMEGVASGM